MEPRASVIRWRDGLSLGVPPAYHEANATHSFRARRHASGARRNGAPVELYLMRHGEAEGGRPDAARRLTAEGAAAVGRVAARAAAGGVRLDRVYHSGLVRARQTAEILAAPLDAAERVAERAGLTPSDPVAPLARWLLDPAMLDDPGSMVLVSHLPLLDALAGRLVAGREGVPAVAFVAGLLVKLLPRPARDGYCILWALPPALA
jgi:phosphohistidine phosphatase